MNEFKPFEAAPVGKPQDASGGLCGLLGARKTRPGPPRAFARYSKGYSEPGNQRF